jgi:hypothetical protein
MPSYFTISHFPFHFFDRESFLLKVSFIGLLDLLEKLQNQRKKGLPSTLLGANPSRIE